MFQEFSCEKSVERRRVNSPNLLQFANENREEGCFNDVMIVAGSDEIEIPANRMVLSCHCIFFERMFKSCWKEQFEYSVRVKGVDGKSMATLIDYLYTGNFTVNEENVADLLPASDYLQLNLPKQYCFEFLSSILSPNNSIYILHVANLYRGSWAFEKEIYDIINSNFDKISQTDDFLSLSSDMLLNYLPNVNRKLVKETSIYQALITWTKFDKDTRQVRFAKLFQQLIDLNRLPHRFLKKNLPKEKLVKKNVECRKLVAVAEVKRCEIEARNYKKTKALLCLGGYETPNKVFELYNLNGKTLLNYPDLPENLSEIHSMRLKNVVYCVGKIHYCMLKERMQLAPRLKGDFSTVSKVWRMNFKNETLLWEEVSPFKTTRISFGATAYDGLLVVTGGVNDYNSVTISVEVFHVGLNEWREISPMMEPRRHHKLVACDGSLYALGGQYIGVLSSMERLSSSCLGEEWEKVQPMRTPRSFFAAVNCCNKIYALGGSDGSWQTLKSVEKYDPVSDQWLYVSDMNIARTQHSVCVMNDCIYVTGGFDEKRKEVKEIECYCPLTNTWTIVGKTSHALFNHSLIAV